MSEWMDIKTAQKTEGTRVLTWDGEWIDVAIYSLGDWFTEESLIKPTHWMPLPKPPKKSGKGGQP